MNHLKAVFSLSLILAMGVAASAVDFSHEIVPVLEKHCAKCHLGDKRKGGFSMNTRVELMKGGENGVAVHLGKAEKSLLYELITTEDEDDRMPPEGDGLDAKEIEAIKKWINEGVTWEAGFRFDKPAYEPPLSRNMASPRRSRSTTPPSPDACIWTWSVCCLRPGSCANLLLPRIPGKGTCWSPKSCPATLLTPNIG